MFRIGDKIVHPMHGAGIVDQIVTRKVNGVLRDYYSLKLPLGDMLVMIPTESCGEIGVRSILSGDETERVLGKIPDLQVEMDTNWNHRYREHGTPQKRRPAGGGQGGQRSHAAGRPAGPVHRGAENAPFGPADLDFRNWIGPIHQLPGGGRPHGPGPSLITCRIQRTWN